MQSEVPETQYHHTPESEAQTGRDDKSECWIGIIVVVRGNAQAQPTILEVQGHHGRISNVEGP